MYRAVRNDVSERPQTSCLCLSHLTPRNCGCSPGALDSLSIFSESMWAMEMTVAATYHGRPIKEQAAIRMPTHSRSRWYPQPFCSKQSESVRKSMEMKRTQAMKDLLSAWIPLTYFPCGWRWQHWSADPWRWGWWPGARGQSLPGKPTTDSFRMASQTNPCQDVWATWFEKGKKQYNTVTN